MRREALCVALVGGLLGCQKDGAPPAPVLPSSAELAAQAAAAAQAKAAADAKAAAEAEAERKKQRINDLLAKAQPLLNKDKDRRPLLALLEEACKLGNMPSCGEVGLMYHQGTGHVLKDIPGAKTLYEAACAADWGNSCHNLAVLYVTGGPGIKKDLSQALPLFEKACRLSNPDSCKAAKETRWDVAISANVIWSAYHNNEVAADNLYKDRQLEVTGTLTSIRKDFADDVVLELKSPNPFMQTSAYVASSEVSKAAELRMGHKVLLSCVGGGMAIGTPSLRKCIIDDVR